MPCTNLACDFESLLMTWPSLGRWISTSRSSSVTQSRKFRYSRSVFSTKTTRHVLCSRRKRTISPNCFLPVVLAVSTSTNSRRMLRSCCRAYSRRNLSCAGIEKPSRSWSLLDTLAYRTACLIWSSVAVRRLPARVAHLALILSACQRASPACCSDPMRRARETSPAMRVNHRERAAFPLWSPGLGTPRWYQLVVAACWQSERWASYEDDGEGRRGGLAEYPSTYTNGQEVRKTFQAK